VVQPHASLYRVGFFSRQSIKPFSPEAPPFDYSFDVGNLKDFLFTKLHNGFLMAMNCPPMNRLFSTPRAATIKELGVNFPKEKKATKKKREKQKEKKLKQDRERTQEKEELILRIIAGRNLVSADSNKMSDPYCIATLLDQKQKTAVVKKSIHPRWDNEVKFNLIGINKDIEQIKIVCQDADRKGKDDYMGEILVPLNTAIQMSSGITHWYPLVSTNSTVVSGELELEFVYSTSQQ